MNTHGTISQIILKEIHWLVFTAAQLIQRSHDTEFCVRQLLHGSITFQDPISHYFRA